MMANSSSVLRVTYFRAACEVAFRMTGQAWPAVWASFHLAAQTHQRSPGLRPGKLYWGMGVLRSLPDALLKARKSAVSWQQMAWQPWSSGPTWHCPSR